MTTQVTSTLPDETIVVLVGAEGAAEIGDAPYLVEIQGNRADVYRWARQHGIPAKDAIIRYGKASLDGTGRPYFLVGVTVEAPEEIRRRAYDFTRVIRLIE